MSYQAVLRVAWIQCIFTEGEMLGQELYHGGGLEVYMHCDYKYRLGKTVPFLALRVSFYSQC